MNITDLRRWTKMNITDPMKNYWEIADSEAKTLLDMPPKPSMETATTTYEQLACCPGRIYYSLLYHHKQLCSELTAFQVFAWACYISYGHLTDVLDDNNVPQIVLDHKTENPPAIDISMRHSHPSRTSVSRLPSTPRQPSSTQTSSHIQTNPKHTLVPSQKRKLEFDAPTRRVSGRGFSWKAPDEEVKSQSEQMSLNYATLQPTQSTLVFLPVPVSHLSEAYRALSHIMTSTNSATVNTKTAPTNSSHNTNTNNNHPTTTISNHSSSSNTNHVDDKE